MTTAQERHLTRVTAQFRALADAKYRRGQKEHGGDLFAHDAAWLLNAAIEEAVDQVIYLLTLKENLAGEKAARRTRALITGGRCA